MNKFYCNAKFFFNIYETSSYCKQSIVQKKIISYLCIAETNIRDYLEFYIGIL